IVRHSFHVFTIRSGILAETPTHVFPDLAATSNNGEFLPDFLGKLSTTRLIRPMLKRLKKNFKPKQLRCRKGRLAVSLRYHYCSSPHSPAWGSQKLFYCVMFCECRAV